MAGYAMFFFSDVIKVQITNICAQRAIGGMAYRSCSGTISSITTPSRAAVRR